MILARKLILQSSVQQCLLCLAVLFGTLSTQVFAQQQAPPPDPTGVSVAPVIVDGNKLFRVRGMPSYPATRRAAEIRQRIIDLASDESFDTAQLTISNEEPIRTTVLAGDREVFNIFEEDAALENIRREILAYVYRDLVTEAIEDYRADRSTVKLVNNSLVALAVTALFAVLLWAFSRLIKWLVAWTERDVRRVGQDLADKAFGLFHASQFWAFIAGLLRLIRTIVYLALIYFYLNAVLGLFPWTRPVARTLIPLSSIHWKASGWALSRRFPT